MEDWSRRPPPSPDASGLPAFPPLSSDFLLLFHFLHPAYFSFFCRQLPRAAGSTSRSVFTCRQNSTLSSFFRSKHSQPFISHYTLFRRKPAIPTRNITFLSIHRPEPRVPAFPAASTPHLQYLFQSKQSQPFISYHAFFRHKTAVILPVAFLSHKSHSTHIRLCRPVPHHQHQTNYQHFPQTPSAISRCLRATSFPRRFAAGFHSSNAPILFFFSFLFFLFSALFLFLFFLSFFFSLSLFFFSLFLLFLSSFLFSFFLLYIFLPIASLFSLFVCTTPKGCKTGQRPESSFLCTVLRMHSFCQAGRRILGAAAGDVHT